MDGTENIILNEVSKANLILVCSPSYTEFRYGANTAMLLDMGHMTREEHIQVVLK
jgi:hypothetical protein